jgi:hypothetical protein
MIKSKATLMVAAAMLFGGCVQNMPAAFTGGPMDPNSVTTFNLNLTPDSFINCAQGDPGMTHPMTLTVQSNTADLLTSGGIHYGLTRVAPNVYAGGNYIKIQADLSAAPRSLTIRSNDRGCTWAGAAA